MKYYVVIDTNVLVSAVLKSHSVPGSIVELAFDGPIIPILNEAIEKEYREVLSRPKFHLPEDLIEGIMSTFHKRAIYVDAEHLDVELPDPKDLVLEEEAYLVTGNIRHFPNRPFIVTPREMLDIILRDQDFRDE